MKAFMTNGTLALLKNIAAKNPDLDFYYMSSSTSTLAYYESTGKDVFSTGRDYEVLISKGDIVQEGFIVMNNIPVTDEGKPVFEDRFRQRQNEVDAMPGFQAFRLLRPLKGNTYVVFTAWKTEQDYNNWKNSDQFKKAHQGAGTKPPAYFAERPFLTHYHMIDPEDLQK